MHWRFTVLSCALSLPLLVAQSSRNETALDRYVRQPDPAFQFQPVSQLKTQDVTVQVLELTSQRFLTEKEIDRPLWKHWLSIYRPDRVEFSTALLIITGGNNGSKPPDKADEFAAAIARKSNSVVAELRMVPNQPVTLAGETRRRSEDSFIAYTWDKYLRTGDEKWPLRLPMTKAAVRAMDAVQSFCSTPDGGGAKVERFVVTGGSKRGWTTWTTAAVDKRVVAIMPVVIDMLNIERSFQHHWRVYGFWAPAVGDYVEAGIMDWQNTQQYRNLMRIEEPYEYRDRLTLPKYIVNSTGDQFFVPDSSQFYFKELKGEKYLRYVPNTDHGVTRRSDAGESLAVYYESILRNWKRPEFTWTIATDGTIEVRTKDKPSAVKLWSATNPDARDFRLEKIGPAYRSETLVEKAPGVYAGRPPRPGNGFTAYFIELTYPTPGGSHWKFTTDVKVTPDEYPFPPYEPKTPAGATLLKQK
jgi:PhoPQ-activated pathogenicity-related protein